MRQICDILDFLDSNNTQNPTGVEFIDKLIGGYKPGEMIVFAGHAVSGRDEMAMAVAKNLSIQENVPVGLFCFPLDWERNVNLIFGSTKTTNCDLFKNEVPLYINDKLIFHAEDLCNEIKKAYYEQDVNCFILCGLSYLHHAAVTSERNRNDDEELVKELKRLCVELGVTLFISARLNWMSWGREGFFKTQLGDLSLVGGYDEYADFVIGIDRPEANDIYEDSLGRDLRGKIQLKVLKGTRNEFAEAIIPTEQLFLNRSKVDTGTTVKFIFPIAGKDDEDINNVF